MMVSLQNSFRKSRHDLQGILAFIFMSGLLCSTVADDQSADSEFYLNVLDFGASGDGFTDDTQAFLEAWTEACSLSGNPTLVIPKYMTFLVYPVVFNGPCQSRSITVQILGTVVAPDSPTAWKGKDAGKWLMFNDVRGLRVTGSGYGALDGRGFAWWNQSCRDHPGMKGCISLAPTAIAFSRCNSSSLSDIVSVNSSQTHFLIIDCKGVTVSNVMMQAPELSPNTDGIHIHSSCNVVITNSIFATGDDCISIGDYTSDVDISNVICGPGHGISIGSLGRGGNFVRVENIHVSRSYLKGTTNGLRIKTWQVGRGYVRKVLFEDVTFDSVENPIIIDQNYCFPKGACKEMPIGVQITNVTYRNMVGSSSTAVAINLNCSGSVPCRGLNLQSIYLWPADSSRTVELAAETTTSCVNAHGQAIQVDPPADCLAS